MHCQFTCLFLLLDGRDCILFIVIFEYRVGV